MRPTARRFLVAAAASLIVCAAAASARAQQPLCPPPAPEETYFQFCSPFAQTLVESFLFDFSVAQLFKSRDGFELPTHKIIDAMGLGKLLFANEADRKQLLADRPMITFQPLDRLGRESSGQGYSSSGEFVSKGLNGPQNVRSVDTITGATVEIEIPEVVQGMYWRSPAHLEMRFYAGHGLRFVLNPTQPTEYRETASCVSITKGEARVTTSDPSKRYLLARFGTCN